MNAKELALSKLNAGINMISTYIYGITIGMDFREISKWLMSKTGEILRKVIDENVMLDTPGYGKLRNAFDYFTKGPSKHLKQFDSFYNYLSEYISEDNNLITKLLNPLTRLKLLLNPTKNPFYIKDDFIIKYIIQLRKDNKSLTDILNDLDSLKNNYIGSNIDRIRFNLLIDFVEKYIILYYDTDPDILNKIKFLTDGAYEMEVLGKIVGLNQGIPNDLEGVLYKSNFIENALEKLLDNDEHKKLLNEYKKLLLNNIISYEEYEDKVKSLTGYYRIDLVKFSFDNNYRQQCIRDYEKVKHSFNILDVVDKLPHVLKYVQSLAVSEVSLQRSYRYRSIKNNYIPVSIISNISTNDAISSLNNYIGDLMIQDWMLSEDINIIIPEGNKIFNSNGIMSEKELTFGTNIKLGSEYANATFRMWIEKLIIPNLKKLYPDNRFIQDLGNDTRNNTLSGNGSVVYTLPINMLPRTDLERAVFNIYLDLFNKLKDYDYKYEVSMLDNNGNKVIKQLSIPIIDIFTYYAMIAHNWKLGESSLTSILEGFLNEGIIKKLHDYIAKLDYSGRELELNSIERRNLVPYVASKKGKYGYSTYAWVYNQTIERFELQKRNIEGLYTPISNVDDLNFINYFSGTIVRDEHKLINKNIKIKVGDNLNTYQLDIEWSLGNKRDKVKITDKNGKVQEVLSEYCKENNLPIKSQYINTYRLTQPNIDLIKDLISQELNKPKTCNTPF